MIENISLARSRIVHKSKTCDNCGEVTADSRRGHGRLEEKSRQTRGEVTAHSRRGLQKMRIASAVTFKIFGLWLLFISVTLIYLRL